MKNLILSTLFFLFYAPISISQSCQLSTHQFTSQLEIDSIPIKHPDCTEILGGVMISSSIDDPITNLNGFSKIKSIDGFLFIRDNPQLFSLDGLDSLTNVGWFFLLDNNDVLSNVNALLQLDSVHQRIQIENNNSLENLSGLSNLSFVGEGLILRNNEMLTNLSGLSNKEIHGELLVTQNNSLITLNGLENLNIKSNCRIISNPALSNFGSLENLSIEKNLVIDENDQLSNLIGLENITELGGGFTISNNDNLMDLEGIENLSFINGNLIIHQNNLLANLDGLENLTTIGGSLFISNNDNLSSLNGIKNIDPFSIKTKSAYYYHQDIYIHDNPLLSICSAQSVCEAMAIAGATTSIHSNASGCNFVLEIGSECGITSTLDTCLLGNSIFTNQKDIDNFPTNYPSCTVIGGNLRIDDSQGNEVLDITHFDSLQQLTSIEGDLLISRSPAVIDLKGFQNLTKIDGALSISGTSITSMSSLEELETVGTDFFIHSNDSLNILFGLDKLSFIGNDLSIYTNRKLKNLQGLDSLKHLGGLEVRYSYLDNFIGLGNVNKIDGKFNIEFNDSLSNFQGLENLDSIMYYFMIKSNPNLKELSGLDNLKFIGHNFSILENNTLTSLEALANLNHIEGHSFTIKKNRKLPSLSGIDNIEMTAPNSIDYILLQDCDSLSFCSVQSVCDYLLMGGGSYNFISNTTGCNSHSQIVDGCDLTLIKSKDLEKKSVVKIFPNPNNGIFEIKMEEDLEGKISIFNGLGSLVFEKNLNLNQTINLSDSSKGIYFVLIQIGDELFSQKIILH